MSRRRTLRLLAIVALILTVATFYLRSSRFVANSGPISYVVTVSEKNPDEVKVEASFTLEDALLYTTHEGPDPKAYAPFLRDMQVHHADGSVLAVTPCAASQLLKCRLWKGWERGRKWLVDARAGAPVVLSYKVALEHARSVWPAGLDSAAFQTAWGIFSTGRALFVMNRRIRSPFVSANLAWMEGVLVPRQDSRQAVRAKFNLPGSWQASTPWMVLGKNSFVADDLIDLSESMLMLGTHDAFQAEQGGTTLTLALGGASVLGESRRLQKAFREAQAYYTGVLGGPPKTAREDPLARAIVVVNSGNVTDGEVIGHNLSMTFIETQPLFEIGILETLQGSQLILPVQIVFHEFFHPWNGVTFASQAEAEWFKEGVTDYYALTAARQLGYLGQNALFTLFGDQYRRHLKSAAGGLSLAEAGKDEFGNSELLYPGGLLVGLSLDLVIRSETNNAEGLDDLMRRVYRDFGASGRALSSEAVQKRAEEISGTDLGDFFGAYVNGAEPIPLTEYLKLAGFDATFKNDKLRLQVRPDATKLAVAVRKSVF